MVRRDEKPTFWGWDRRCVPLDSTILGKMGDIEVAGLRRDKIGGCDVR